MNKSRIMVVVITVLSIMLMASVSVFSWGSRGTPCVGCHTVFNTTVQVSASVSEFYVTAGEESSSFTVTVTGAGYDKRYTQAALRVPEGWGAGGDFINYVEDREVPGIWDSYHTIERGDPDHTETFTGTIIVPSDITEGNYTVEVWGAGCDETNTKASDKVLITVHVTFLSDIRGPEGVPDGKVDMWDFGFFGLAYGKSSADPDWNDYKIADIRGPSEPDHPPDGVVDMWDFGYCGLEYGSSI